MWQTTRCSHSTRPGQRVKRRGGGWQPYIDNDDNNDNHDDYDDDDDDNDNNNDKDDDDNNDNDGNDDDDDNDDDNNEAFETTAPKEINVSWQMCILHVCLYVFYKEHKNKGRIEGYTCKDTCKHNTMLSGSVHVLYIT